MDETTPPHPDEAPDSPAGAEPAPLPEPGAIPPPPGGCGLRGCLYGTMALFVLLMGLMLVIALTHVWFTPAVR